MIRIAIIGVGKIVEDYHIPILSEFPNILISHLIDVDVERVSKKYGRGNYIIDRYLTPYQDYDMCLVATPPSVRLAVLSTILNGDAHIIWEKPFGLDFDETKELFNRVNKRKGLSSVAQTRRSFPNYMMIEDGIKSLNLKPVYLELNEGSLFKWDTRSDYMLDNADLGVLSDIGSHTLDSLKKIIEINGSWEALKINKVTIKDKGKINDVLVEFMNEAGDVFIKLKLSRTRALSNLVRVRCEGGITFVTPTGWSKDVYLEGWQGSNIQLQLPDSYPQSVMDSFRFMWEEILGKDETSDKYSVISVLPVIKSINEIINL